MPKVSPHCSDPIHSPTTRPVDDPTLDFVDDLDPVDLRIQVLRPQLPTAEAIHPYLRRIDASRVYTNLGPLASELEERIATLVGGGSASVVAASSGSAAISAAILATAGPARPDRPLAAMPAYTFVATALAAQVCGHAPLLIDVRVSDWLLDPRAVESHPELHRIGVVVPVAPYGRPVEQAAWSRFSARTGIPVVIDGAASLDRLVARPVPYVGDLPVAISLHATKSYGIGEGGAVISTSTELSEAISAATNNGFLTSRVTSTRAFNGKLSEHAAAVGLAAFDGWGTTQARFEAVAADYRAAFTHRSMADRLVATPEIGSSYVIVECRDAAEARSVRSSLTDGRIGHRLWYGGGLHRMPLYAPEALGAWPVSDDVAARLIGIPTAPDLGSDEVVLVTDAIAAGIKRGELRPMDVEAGRVA